MLTCDDYLSPRSLAEAFDAMATHAGGFRLVAGATDILPWAREGRAGDVHIPTLIDISGIDELRAISANAGRIRIGAATKIQRFLDSDLLKRNLPCMSRCAVWFADDQIRECATIGGNLINGSPAADGAPPLIAHDARVELASRRHGKIERRTMALTDFVQGPSRTAIAPDEIMVAIECDALPEFGGSFEKVGHRRSLVIAIVCLATLMRLDRSGTRVEDVRLAIGGVGPVPSRLHDVEAFLKSAPLSASVLADAAEMPLGSVQSRTRQDYRREVVRGFMLRGLITAARRAGAGPDIISPELEASYA